MHVQKVWRFLFFSKLAKVEKNRRHSFFGDFISKNIFKKEELECHDTLTICPSHRNNNGVGWRCGRKNCDSGITPRGGGGGGYVLSYMGHTGMCRCEGYGFQAVYSSIGYINQSVWV